MNRTLPPHRYPDRDPRWMIFVKRVGIIAASTSAVLGLFKSYLMDPLRALFHHVFNRGGSEPS